MSVITTTSYPGREPKTESNTLLNPNEFFKNNEKGSLGDDERIKKVASQIPHLGSKHLHQAGNRRIRIQQERSEQKIYNNISLLAIGSLVALILYNVISQNK